MWNNFDRKRGDGNEDRLYSRGGKKSSKSVSYILPSIAKLNVVALCRLRSSRQSRYVALAEGV